MISKGNKPQQASTVRVHVEDREEGEGRNSFQVTGCYLPPAPSNTWDPRSNLAVPEAAGWGAGRRSSKGRDSAPTELAEGAFERSNLAALEVAIH